MSKKRRSRDSVPRYPDLRVRVRSGNPLALVAATREELRLAGVGADEIRDFSDQALSTGVDRKLVQEVVAEWIGEFEAAQAV